MPNKDEGLLLAPEERKEAYSKAEKRWQQDGKGDIYEFNFLWQYIADEVSKAQREITLKEVGEWLGERVTCSHLHYWHRRFTCEACIEALERGEMK